MKHLYACLNANQFLFSSQTKILIIPTTLLKDKDPADELQRDFILHKWVIKWQMKFCAEKKTQTNKTQGPLKSIFKPCSIQD